MVFCFLVFGCQYQSSQMLEKTRLQNDLLCVEWDIKPHTLTHSLTIIDNYSMTFIDTFYCFIVTFYIVSSQRSAKKLLTDCSSFFVAAYFSII